MIDLFDDSDDSDEDRKRTLIELVVKNKRRRRRLLRKVKHLKMSLTNERVYAKAKQTHKQETSRDTTDQKNITSDLFSGVD